MNKKPFITFLKNVINRIHFQTRQPHTIKYQRETIRHLLSLNIYKKLILTDIKNLLNKA